MNTQTALPAVGAHIDTPSGDTGIVTRITKAYVIYMSDRNGYEMRVHQAVFARASA